MNAQNDFAKTIRVIPGASFGYTFGSGLNASFDCAFSFFDYKVDKSSGYTALHFSYAIFTHKKELYDNGFYRTFSVNIMNVVNNQFIVRLGKTKTKLKWGLGNRNTNRSNGWGFNFDVAAAPVVNFPFIGFRYFRVNNQCLGLGGSNPKFLYLGYQYPITLIENKN